MLSLPTATMVQFLVPCLVRDDPWAYITLPVVIPEHRDRCKHPALPWMVLYSRNILISKPLKYTMLTIFQKILTNQLSLSFNKQYMCHFFLFIDVSSFIPFGFHLQELMIFFHFSLGFYLQIFYQLVCFY